MFKIFQKNDNVEIDSSEPTAIPIPVRRSASCPFARRNRQSSNSFSKSHAYIPLASVCLLELVDASGLILTRRPWHMRSYPGLWVPPGGHCDPAESIENTAVRELCEELGFELMHCKPLKESLHLLCAWEAAYPTSAPPKSHHLVLYYAARLPEFISRSPTNPALPQLKLQENEVSGAVCLPFPILRKLTNDWLCCDSVKRCSSDYSVAGSELASTKELNAITNPVWYWTTDSRSWNLVPFNELICGMSDVRRSPDAHLSRPTPLSSGTAYAIHRFLSWHDSL